MRTVTALVAEGGERLLYTPLTGGESGVAGQQNTNPRTSGLDAGSGFGERCLEPAGQLAQEPAQPLLVFVTEDHIHDAAVRRQGEGGAFPEQQGGQRLPIGRGAQGQKHRVFRLCTLDQQGRFAGIATEAGKRPEGLLVGAEILRL